MYKYPNPLLGNMLTRIDSPNQKRMENALKTANSLDPQERQATIDWMRQAGGPNGIDKYLKKYDIDVIIGPADCECTEPPAAAGKHAFSSARDFLLIPSRISSGYDATLYP